MKTEDDAMHVKLVFFKGMRYSGAFCSGFGGFDRAIFNHRMFTNIKSHFCMTSSVSAPILKPLIQFILNMTSYQFNDCVFDAI